MGSQGGDGSYEAVIGRRHRADLNAGVDPEQLLAEVRLFDGSLHPAESAAGIALKAEVSSPSDTSSQSTGMRPGNTLPAKPKDMPND